MTMVTTQWQWWQRGRVFSAIVYWFYRSHHSSVRRHYFRWTLHELSNWVSVSSAFENNQIPLPECNAASSDLYSNWGWGRRGWIHVSCLQRTDLKIRKEPKNTVVRWHVGHCFTILTEQWLNNGVTIKLCSLISTTGRYEQRNKPEIFFFGLWSMRT